MLEAHRSPRDMARVLVQYIDDARMIRSHIRSEFQTSISLSDIEAMRAEHKRPDEPPIAWKIEADRYAEHMELANRSFLRRLFDAHPYLQEKVA